MGNHDDDFDDGYGMEVDEGSHHMPSAHMPSQQPQLQPSASEAQLNAAIAASMESAQHQPQPGMSEDEELARVLEMSKQFK